MPNHVTNIVKMDRICYCPIFSYRIDEGPAWIQFDFNKIIPMPAHIFNGDLDSAAFEKYGRDNWYNWSMDNWGTKWNSYNNRIINVNTVAFDAAWECPHPIMLKLSTMYPNTTIECWWSDEGNINGYQMYRNGECIGGICTDPMMEEEILISCFGFLPAIVFER